MLISKNGKSEIICCTFFAACGVGRDTFGASETLTNFYWRLISYTLIKEQKNLKLLIHQGISDFSWDAVGGI